MFLIFAWKGARKGSAAVGFFGFFLKTSRNPTDKIKTPLGRGGGREGKACRRFTGYAHVFRSGGGWRVCGFTREHLVFLGLKKNLKTTRGFSP